MTETLTPERVPSGAEMRPVPDPTVLTTQQLLREIAMLRELIETRIGGMDKAIELLQRTTDKYPAFVEAQVGQLRLLHEEKFRSVQTQFTERDTRTEETQKSSKVAVDAALQAAKEAVGEQNKSNALTIGEIKTAFTKQTEGIIELIRSNGKASDDQTRINTKANDDKISDLKDRVTAIEGRTKGAGESWTVAASVLGILIAIAAVIVAVVVHK